MLVEDIEPRLTATAYLKWIDYFNQLNGGEVDILQDDDALLKEFDLGR